MAEYQTIELDGITVAIALYPEVPVGTLTFTRIGNKIVLGTPQDTNEHCLYLWIRESVAEEEVYHFLGAIDLYLKGLSTLILCHFDHPGSEQFPELAHELWERRRNKDDGGRFPKLGINFLSVVAKDLS